MVSLLCLNKKRVLPSTGILKRAYSVAAIKDNLFIKSFNKAWQQAKTALSFPPSLELSFLETTKVSMLYYNPFAPFTYQSQYE